MEWVKSILAFFVEHRELLAIAIGVLIAWASTFILEQKIFPLTWSQRKCEANAILISIVFGSGYTYGFWRIWVPDDGRGYVFLVATACGISQPFVYWAVSKLIGWKWPGLDLTFGQRRKDPPVPPVAPAIPPP